VAAAGTATVLVLVVLPGAGVRLPLSSWPPDGWVLVACDVGQGDGLVLSAGPGAAVVVDTGPDPALMDRCLTRLGVRAVPVLVLSHDHADHVEGLPGVLRGGRAVGVVLVSPLDDPPAESSRVHRWAQDAGVPVRAASAGEQLAVGELQWSVLWPDRLLHGTESDPNNASLVLLVRSHGITLLLGGDIEPEAQRLLLRDHPPGEVDVVKVPHHGSAHQDPDYATATDPEVALVSCGVDNSYGHPAAATLHEYAVLGAAVGRTDTEGDLAVVVGATGEPVLLARGK
jgi:competence protein ComEC